MPKLIIIVVGLVFAVIGYRKTWYPSWAFLFNVLIAVYVSIMITPQVVDRFVIIENYLRSYSYAAFALFVAAVIFYVMHLLSFTYLTAACNVSFPKIFNNAGASVLGFLAGSVITGFLLFLVAITPLSRFEFVKNFTQGKQPSDHISCILLSSCNVVHDLSLQPIPDAVAKQFEGVMMGWKQVKDVNSTSDNNLVKTPQKSVSDMPSRKIDRVMTDLGQTAEVVEVNTPSDNNLTETLNAIK